MNRGIKLLLEHIGSTETEKFISVILREKFDYTEWRKSVFDDIDSKEFNENAANYAKLNPLKFKKKQIEI